MEAPKGFLQVLDEKTLAFADYTGNAQYISIGNLSQNDQAFLFLMDYPNRRRVKIWGTAEVVEDDSQLLLQLSAPEYRAHPERVFLFHVKAWDVNCPQHIKPRYTEEEVDSLVQSLQNRVTELEAENHRLRKRLVSCAENESQVGITT